MLHAVYESVAGLDVHKRIIVATRMRVDEGAGGTPQETRTFGTTTPELLVLHDWLAEWSCTHIAMESTGDYWKPAYNVLEGTFAVWVVNAEHVKHVPGRKTDVESSDWLAQLMLHGLLRPSFVPPKPQRALRELTRYRSKVVEERSRTVNRVQKLLEGANIKLASVATDVMGVSGQAMLAAICEGRMTPEEMADLARGRLRNKIPELEKALTGLVEPHHRFLLSRQLTHIDFLDEQIADLSAEIVRQMEEMNQACLPAQSDTEQALNRQDAAHDTQSPLTWTAAIELLDTIPGVSVRVAEVILAEIGLDMSRFPTAEHLAAWAGVAPGNYESAGRRRSGRRRKGNKSLVTILVEAAHAAAHTKDTFLKARYHRLAARRGKNRAAVAVAHSILISVWHMLTHRQPYKELGSDFFDQRRKDSKINYLIRQLEKLTGTSVHIELQPSTA